MPTTLRGTETFMAAFAAFCCETKLAMSTTLRGTETPSAESFFQSVILAMPTTLRGTETVLPRFLMDILAIH